ncbi:MAG: 50S ribosomal protein L6 [Spirochaetaceae bacterium]|nr:50S ribosomal protein L6 [Spirochaetaceae bacterium]
MSRIGKLPVVVPQDVKVTITGNNIIVEGKKGKLERKFRSEVSITQENNLVHVKANEDTKEASAYHGLYRTLINNMVKGVSEGFKKMLIINGVGYRAEVVGKSLILNIGYSTQFEYPILEGLTITVEGNNKLTISGIDKERVGQTCAEIRSFRKPEPYKGKGIKYENEVVRRKVGKSGAK